MYYVYNKETNQFDGTKINTGWIHVYDIEKFHDKFFLSGSVTSGTYSIIQVSKDGGNTFENSFLYYYNSENVLTKVPANSNMRCYNMSVLGDELYGRVYFSESSTSYSGIYRYDEEKNIFIQTNDNTFPGSGFNKMHFHTFDYNGESFYLSYNLYKISKNDAGGLSFSKFDKTYGIDQVVVGDTLYILYYGFNNQTRPTTYDAIIYKTTDLENFEQLYRFNTNTDPFAIEYYDNKLYVGTKYNTAFGDLNKTGALYEIDLDKFINSLEINEEEKIINISKDGLINPVSYKLDADKSNFATTLTFNKNMEKRKWEQEFTKFKNLNLIYSLVDYEDRVDLDSSSLYYDNAIKEVITNASKEYTTAIEFANGIFGNDINISNDRFSLKTNKVSETEDEIKVQVNLEVYDIDDITSSIYKVNEDNDFIYIENETNEETIKSNLIYSDKVNIDLDLENNKISVIYNKIVLKEYKVIRSKINKEIKDNFIYTSNLSDKEILDFIDVINCDKVVNNDVLQIKYKDIVLKEYKLIRIITKDVTLINDSEIFVGNKTNDEISENLIVTNAEILYKNNKILIMNGDNVVQEFTKKTIDFGKYTVIDNYVYIFKETDIEIIKSNIKYSSGLDVIVDLENNKIIVKNNDVILKEYLLVRIEMNIDIIDKSIYVSDLSDEEILDLITIYNGEKTINNNELEIKCSNKVVDKYKLIRVKFVNSLIDNKIYGSNKDIDYIKENLEVINAEAFYSNDKIALISNGKVIQELDLLFVDYKNYINIDNNLLIPKDISYDTFISNISFTSGLTFKFYNNNIEVKDILSEGLVLKIRYKDIELESLNVVNEYLEFDSKIIVDDDNKYLYNIDVNSYVSDIISYIKTTGKISFYDKDNNLLNEDDKVVTGTNLKIKLIDSEQHYSLIVSGDVNGDGVLTLKDIMSISDHVYGKKYLNGVYLKAADYDLNNKYELHDIMKYAKKLNGGN